MRPNSKPREPGRLMSQVAAAKALGIHRSTVLARIAAGELEAEMVDDRPVVVRASVDAYLARQTETVPA